MPAGVHTHTNGHDSGWGEEHHRSELCHSQRRACACSTEKHNEISENVQELLGAPEQILDSEDLHEVIGTTAVTIHSNLQN